MSRKIPFLLVVLCVLACNEPPEFLPPPFGPKGPSNTELFYPGGMAVHPTGALVVANSNANRAFDRPQLGLGRPAAELGAVVLDG